MTLEYLVTLSCLAVVSFVQNMAFTWSSRSRNSGNPAYHRRAAWGSNGIWFLCQLFVVKLVWKPIIEGSDLWLALFAGLVYMLATAEGSVCMMKILLKKEKGSTRVGARR